MEFIQWWVLISDRVVHETPHINALRSRINETMMCIFVQANKFFNLLLQ